MLCGLASIVLPGIQKHLFDFDAYISNRYLRARYPIVCTCVYSSILASFDCG